MILKVNKSLVSTHVVIADHFFKRFLGWMFKRCVSNDEVIVINPCNSIHTFFMNFPIDVLFVDYDHKVIKTSEAVIKNKVILPVKDSYYVIESKSGTIADYSIKIGDTVEIV